MRLTCLCVNLAGSRLLSEVVGIGSNSDDLHGAIEQNDVPHWQWRKLDSVEATYQSFITLTARYRAIHRFIMCLTYVTYRAIQWFIMCLTHVTYSVAPSTYLVKCISKNIICLSWDFARQLKKSLTALGHELPRSWSSAGIHLLSARFADAM